MEEVKRGGWEVRKEEKGECQRKEGREGETKEGIGGR